MAVRQHVSKEANSLSNSLLLYGKKGIYWQVSVLGLQQSSLRVSINSALFSYGICCFGENTFKFVYKRKVVKCGEQ